MRGIILGLVTALGLGVMKPAVAEMVTLTTKKIGAWEVEEQEDGLTSERRWLAVTGSKKDGGMLALKCDGNGNGVYFHAIFFRYMGGDYDEREFTYRVDQVAPVTTRMQYKESNALEFDKDAVYAIASKIRDGKVLRFRGLTYDFESVDVKLSINGAREALKMVYVGCQDSHWKD